MAADPDVELRAAAVERVRALAIAHDDLIPREVLAQGFVFDGQRVAFSSFQKGIHRSRLQKGPAALSLVTSYKDPYGDRQATSGGFQYAYRAGAIDQADNRALRAAFELRVPVLYFRAVVPGQYFAAAPMFVVSDDPGTRAVVLESGLPVQDLTEVGLVSKPDVRAYATADTRRRLHQQRFRVEVMRAYRGRCAVCVLKEPKLVQAAHILPDTHPDGLAEVSNGLVLCAIHHLAYDRNLLGIDPNGVIHISKALRDEIDGPMLANGLQHFHGAAMAFPHRPADRPSPQRLAIRFDEFQVA